MSTVSTDAIYQLIRTRLLTYVDPDGHTLTEALGTRMWRLSPPDNLKAADYPFAVLSLKSPQMPEGSDRIKLTYDLEVMFFARPVGSHAALEALGDRAVAALATWKDGSSGLVWIGGVTAVSLPTLPAPADPDVQQVRVTASLSCYPTLLTRLSS